MSNIRPDLVQISPFDTLISPLIRDSKSARLDLDGGKIRIQFNLAKPALISPVRIRVISIIGADFEGPRKVILLFGFAMI